MKGRLYLYRPGDDRPKVVDLARPPNTSELQYMVGGEFEQVPGFLEYGEPGQMKSSDCVAFCNANGKDQGLDYNEEATVLWCTAMAMDLSGWDRLCGTVVVLCGDPAFMRRI